MELRIVHLYPDLMSLYGSYANVSVLRRMLETLGNTVTVERIAPGEVWDATGADFLYLGAGTERSQKAALRSLLAQKTELCDAATAGVTLLFAGTAMELLGASITDDRGEVFPALGLAAFTSVQGKRRFVGDVYGHSDLCGDAVVGFMNKCAVISGVETPLIQSLDLGFGNEKDGGAEGYHAGSLFASELTGPLLVKNPGLLRCVVESIYARRGVAAPTELPFTEYETQGYAITARALQLRCKKD